MTTMDKPRFGTLVVVVDRARNLPNRKKIGKQDAYAIVRLGHEVQRTPTDKRAGQVPNWNHEVRFQVPSESENILKISVFNEDSKVPDLIGDCSIDLSDLYQKHEFDNWFDLKYKEKPAGEIYAELTFYYEGPPRPKPKIELPDAPNYAMSASTRPASRGLPSIPHTSQAMMPPARQRTMSPVGRTSFSAQPYDLAAAMNQLDLHQPAPIGRTAYVESPYQPGIRYADTWNGERDTRVIKPAPGDVRRKSFSTETARPRNSESSSLRQEFPQEERFHDSLPPRRNSYMDSHHVHAGRQAAHAYSYSHSGLPCDESSKCRNSPVNGDYRRGQIASRHSPEHGSPIGMHMHEQIQYVDPVLDPRHGSLHELRNSPRITSPRPDRSPTHPRSPDFYRDSDHPMQPNLRKGTERNGSFDALATDRPYKAQLDYDVIPPTANVVNSNTRRAYGHAQAQSMSYAAHSPGQMRSSQMQYAHTKAASTSHMSQMEISRQNESSYHAGNRPDYAYDLSQQRRNTYAVTPAQYAAQNRPLPVAPDAPPTLPAKIPLGLTQEEYNILYGR